MKDFLVFAATVLLAATLYAIIMGDDASSMKNKTGDVFEQQVQIYKQTP